MTRAGSVRWLIAICLLPLLSPDARAADDKTHDVVVYGGTAGGIVAAISAAREGASVVVLEPTEHVGGMVTGGVGRTDVGVGESIGGIAAEFYRLLYRHYSDPSAWKFQTRDE